MKQPLISEQDNADTFIIIVADTTIINLSPHIVNYNFIFAQLGGEKLGYRECRVKRGIKQTAVAKILGVSASAVCAWERGASEPKADIIRKLAALYEVTIDELMKGEGRK